MSQLATGLDQSIPFEPPKFRPHMTPSPGVLFQKELKRRLRLVKARAMAEAHGGTCLSTKVPAHDSALRWQCARGHAWKNTYCMILCECFWCPNCPEDGRKDPSAILVKYMEKLNVALESGKLQASSDVKKDKT